MGLVTITFPGLGEWLASIDQHPFATVVLLLVVIVIVPAVWSNKPVRRCAGAAVLSELLCVLVAVTSRWALPDASR